MADELDELEERLLAQYGSNAVRGSDGRRYEVEPYRNPLASSNFKQFEWAKNNPQIASPLAELLKYLSFMPMGRSTAGLRIGRDNVMAGRLDQAGGTAITGGSTAPRAGASWDNPAVAQSSTGLAYEPGMTYAGGQASRHAGAGYPSRWTEPANSNVRDIRINNPYMDAHIAQQWRQFTQRPGSEPPEVFPRGKAEFDAARLLSSTKGSAAEARAAARELGLGDDVFRALDLYSKPIFGSIPGGKKD